MARDFKEERMLHVFQELQRHINLARSLYIYEPELEVQLTAWYTTVYLSVYYGDNHCCATWVRETNTLNVMDVEEAKTDVSSYDLTGHLGHQQIWPAAQEMVRRIYRNGELRKD